MGWGDDLMWLGEANKVHQENPDAVIHDGREYSVMWDNVPWVVEPGYKGDKRKILVPRKPGGNRWYIEGWGNGRMYYKPYNPIPAPYRCKPEERKWAVKQLQLAGVTGPFVLINPDTKNTTFANNKQWGFKRWNQLCKLLSEKGIQCVRTKPNGPVVDVSGHVKYTVPPLSDCINITTPTIRHMMAILEQSCCAVTSEGGVHHAAAAFNKRAFVIFGGVSSIDSTGYSNRNQTYYTYDHPKTPCGSQHDCDHCKQAMDSIKVDTIAKDVLQFMMEIAPDV